MEPEVGVFLFTGFLESGKTTFIKNALRSDNLGEDEKTALLVFEEGEEEYDSENLGKVDLFYLEKTDLNPDSLEKIRKTGEYTRIFVEYNGMWDVGEFFDAMPDAWGISQIMLFFNCEDILEYNRNMRQLVFDKVQYSDLVVFNRYKSGEDKTPYHKLVRAITRNSDIIFENERGAVEEDDVDDPLPFDMNADIIDIEDRDYAYFYRELSENMKAFEGKKVRFKCVTAYDKSLGPTAVVVGRHIMTCCEADTKYCGIIALHDGKNVFGTGDWRIVTGRIKIGKHKVYRGPGPILVVEKFVNCAPLYGSDAITTFY